MALNEDYQSAWSHSSSFFQGISHFLRYHTRSYDFHTFSFGLNISGASYYAELQVNRHDHNNYFVDFGAHVDSTDLALKQAAAAIKTEARAMGFNTEDTLNVAGTIVQSLPNDLGPRHHQSH